MDSEKEEYATQDKAKWPTAVSDDEFQRIKDGVKAAISCAIHPSRISQGSSGSYFARNQDGQIVAVFKPKNEEPYGKLNPKWTKWLHRHCCPCFFGRSW
jgi:phosphatidylinositol 4-kinase type 2